jgi:hypothetical protein
MRYRHDNHDHDDLGPTAADAAMCPCEVDFDLDPADCPVDHIVTDDGAPF